MSGVRTLFSMALLAGGIVMLFLAYGLWSEREDAGASHSSATIQTLGIDMDVSGNDARTRVGTDATRDACARVDEGETLQIDVFVDEVPPDRGIAAFDFDLLFDADHVTVMDVDLQQLLAQADGSIATRFGEPSSTDGSLSVAVVDLQSTPGIEPDGASEVGSGILARIALTGQTGSGVSDLILQNVTITDDANEETPVETVLSAQVAVNTDCVAEPTPTATPTATSTPAATSTVVATATATPTPAATATATPTAVATATATPESSPTATATPTPAATASPTATPTPTAVGQGTPTATPTSVATATPTSTPDHSPTPTSSATAVATATATSTPTASPTATATASSDPSPTATATPAVGGVVQGAASPTPGAGGSGSGPSGFAPTGGFPAFPAGGVPTLLTVLSALSMIAGGSGLLWWARRPPTSADGRVPGPDVAPRPARPRAGSTGVGFLRLAALLSAVIALAWLLIGRRP